jgi:hypothetical protein
MKTPREIILARHRDAEAKLKDISAESLAARARETQPQTKRAGQDSSAGASLFGRFWLEAMLPWRRAWLGMAAVWLGIVVLHLSTSDRPAREMAGESKPDPQVKMALLEQRQMLAQLLEPIAPPPRSQRATSGPRSDLRLEEVVV